MLYATVERYYYSLAITTIMAKRSTSLAPHTKSKKSPKTAKRLAIKHDMLVAKGVRKA